MNPELNPQDAELAKLLERTAQSIQTSPAFMAELEEKLNNSPVPQRGGSRSAWNNVFPTLGWAVSLAVLALGLNWAIRSFVVSTPQPASGATPTELVAPQGTRYDFNGTPLYLNAPLPTLQSDMPIFSIQPEQLATEESVRALADQFYMNGQLYKTPGFLQDDFVVVAGNRRLQVRSDQYFTYYPDYPRAQRSQVTSSEVPNAEQLIADFFSANGFDFQYSVEFNASFGAYYVNALTEDGRIIVNESVTSHGARFQFDSEGIVLVDFGLLNYAEVGKYGILNAEQALQILLQSSQRMQMSVMSLATMPEIWYREYPVDETLTYWGFISSLPSANGGEALVSIDGYTVTGNVSDVPANTQFLFVQVTGHFRNEGEVKSFVADSWSAYEGYEDYLTGRIELTAAGPQIATEDRGVVRLAALPANLPVPAENACVSGIANDGIFEWKTIQSSDHSFCGGGGGGGGGGGLGFFQLNLSGTVVPLPTPQIFPTPIPFDQLPTGQLYEGLSGTLTVNIRTSEDGTERMEYIFQIAPGETDISYFSLSGDGLEALKDLHNRPLKVWGRLDHYDEFGSPILIVERYEVPYPGLQPQILHGRISATEVDGEVLSLFIAEDGTTYAMLDTGGIVSGSAGVKGDGSEEMQAEVLIVPGEAYAGYPAVRVFSLAPAFDENGNPIDIGSSANEPNIFPDFPAPAENFYYVVEKVELVYYIADQRYIATDATGLQPYIQPVWRFSGHASDGSSFTILIQTLQDPYLQPDPAFYTQPG